jgi:hypothetical protein
MTSSSATIRLDDDDDATTTTIVNVDARTTLLYIDDDAIARGVKNGTGQRGGNAMLRWDGMGPPTVIKSQVQPKKKSRERFEFKPLPFESFVKFPAHIPPHMNILLFSNNFFVQLLQ